MQRKLLSIFFIILIISSIFIPISNASNYLYLNNLEFYVQINSDGSMNVIEIWDIDIEDTNTLFKTFETDLNKYSSITDVKVTDITNGANNEFTQINTYMYHVTKNCYYGLTNEGGDFEIAWGVGLDNSNGVRKYKIEYKVNDAIAKYNDYAELYWQFIGNDFKISAGKVTGIVYLPQNVNSKENIKVWAHSKDLNGTIYATDLNKIEFKMDNYNSGRYMEVRILFPTSQIISTKRIYSTAILENAIAEETAWAEEANVERKLESLGKNIVNFVYGIIIAGIIFFTTRIFKFIKDLKSMNDKITTQKIEYYRDLPDDKATPGEAMILLQQDYYSEEVCDFDKIFFATLLDLCLKGYISLKVEKQEKDKDIIKIEKLNKDRQELKGDEETILKFVLCAIGNKNEITMKELGEYIEHIGGDFYKAKKSTIDYICYNLEESGYFDNEEHDKYTRYSDKKNFYLKGAVEALLLMILTPLSLRIPVDYIYSILLLILGTVFMINAGLCDWIMQKTNVLTQSGLEQTEKWKGLKKYMKDFSLLNEREVPELILWEKYLVYATAFGISDQVLKQLKIAYPNIEELNGTNAFTYMHLMYNSNFNMIFSKEIRSSILSASYSSGSGSGGGFSGGGGRRWRRPEAEEEDKLSLFCRNFLHNKLSF